MIIPHNFDVLKPQPSTVLTIQLDHPLLIFNPLETLGAGIDECDTASVRKLFSRHNVTAFRATGLHSFTYRLYTELNVQAWHWNPKGTWSDTAHDEGYFRGNAVPGKFITSSDCYALPRRGDTSDQGDNKSYSRLDDGDNRTFWKSDPYLGTHYTDEPDSAHPQWVIADMARSLPVNAVSIDWMAPYATSFKVQYWTGSSPFDHPNHGTWLDFSRGSFVNMHGGHQLLRVAHTAHNVQFIRFLMTVSSHTSISPSNDPRDRQGYAIAEIGIGTMDANRHFEDAVHHNPSSNQTSFSVSSTDPWHRATDFLPGWDQPGLDLCFGSGLSKGEASLVPVAMLYSTPEDAVAELSYLQARGDRLAGVELGEEPDGQNADPEDYACLYIQWARAIRKRFPNLPIGGPVLSSIDAQATNALDGVTDWLPRFVNYLRLHSALDLLNFVSTEHYPYNSGIVTAATEAKEPATMQRLFDIVRDAKVPKNVPVDITETNMSGGASNTSWLVGARWAADAIGSIFTHDNAGRFYFYEFDPFGLGRAYGDVWASYCPFTTNTASQVQQPTSQYWALRMITHDWLNPAGGNHTSLGTTMGQSPGGGPVQLSSYAVRRPHGTVAVLIVNHDDTMATRLQIVTPPGSRHCEVRVESSATYVWHDAGANSYASPDVPPSRALMAVGKSAVITIPAGSVVTVHFLP